MVHRCALAGAGGVAVALFMDLMYSLRERSSPVHVPMHGCAGDEGLRIHLGMESVAESGGEWWDQTEVWGRALLADGGQPPSTLATGGEMPIEQFGKKGGERGRGHVWYFQVATNMIAGRTVRKGRMDRPGSREDTMEARFRGHEGDQKHKEAVIVRTRDAISGWRAGYRADSGVVALMLDFVVVPRDTPRSPHTGAGGMLRW